VTLAQPPGDRDVVEHYARPSLGAPARWDEMVDPARGIREPWREIGSVLRLLGPHGLTAQRRTVARLLEDDGVTYRSYGSQQEQPWLLDPVPMLLDEAQWSELEPALAQRAQLLDLVLTDLYGPRRLIAQGLIPPEVVFGHAGFVRAADQVRLPGPRQLLLAAADLARAPDGQWQVLADHTQAPSGTGYSMANRRVVSRALPGLYRDTRIRRIGPYFHAMRLALQQVSPTQNEVPRVVLLTSGAHSETAFDQAFLATLLGIPLVEGRDLTVRDGAVWQRSIGRLEPVDVILRRVDAWFCDPLELRPDSQLGVPGLVEAARLGNVSVVNGLGTGVLENPALYPYLPRLAEVLLDQPLWLQSVQTWWCGDELSRQHVLSRLDSMVIKPVSRRIVGSSRFGWELSATQRDELARWIAADPIAWVGQEAVLPSTAPGVGAAGLEARAVVLRSFAVADGSSYRLLAGGLSRVAPKTGAIVVSTQQGAAAKDVWVLASPTSLVEDRHEPDLVAPERVVAAISPRIAEDLFWLGRYAERAENLGRLAGVMDNRWHDVHHGADPAVGECVRVLRDALVTIAAPWPQLADDGTQDPHRELCTLIGDEKRTGTLAYDARHIRELASATRDQLSNDTWAVLSGLDRGLRPFADGARGDVPAALSALREALLAFAGLAAESMVRDSGWHFMDAGRRIERALHVARLLGSCLVAARSPAVDALVVESLLIATESIITHRRRYRAESGVDTVLELVVFDRDNPRALAYQLDQLKADVRRIPVAGPLAEHLEERVLRTAARLWAAEAGALAVVDSTGRRTALEKLLGRLVAELHEFATAVEAAHFVQPPSLRQLVPIAGLESLEAV
jgi:uncharacterized circularly permuted ATP-grasp superfamily protein/uncharacterized alpha-E superfamily protein